MKKYFAITTIIFFTVCPIIGSAKEVPGQAEFKTDGINICVNIHSSIYTYKITNLNTSPITDVEVKQHAAYNFIVPESWEKEASSDTFHAWTTNTKASVGNNKTAEFSLRVSSKGAVLGRAPVKIKFESGKTIVVPDVWVPVPEPRSYIALIAGLIFTVISVHTIILNRKSNSKKPHINDA